MNDLRAKPPYGTDAYLDWKLNEVTAIGYVIGYTRDTEYSGVIDANAFGQYFAERCNTWRDLDRLYDQFTGKAAS